ncbi:MAG TPA: helix-turn-helix domain-containing protein [Saprospiraceae bacterium]|nr:helix-turn-helix transcriptional regulator [Saprospiraceae bacterium]HPG08756.1 helix-turn-helix domain-containing protein [Saprospiraceae bacterium]HQU54095.1 helix-turn-helix domain-containing protein [Saprospiraceae bacterium]HRV84625.1 helix-turn-helix domain-containing protein [Saprospiraceae bacterium]
MENNFSQEYLIERCPVQHTLQFIGGKWRIGILWSMKDGCRRFGELKKDVLGISEKMLIQELRHLERADIIHRNAYATIPPKVEYSLTERGLSLIPVLMDIVAWGYSDMKKKGFSGS